MKPAAPNLDASPIRAQASAPWESVALRDLSECLLEAYDAVACRADELLQERGDNPGDELEDWRRAEDEVLQKIPIDVQESDLAITALANVPGYSAGEIELGIDSRWIVILGRHACSQVCTESAGREHASDNHVGGSIFGRNSGPYVDECPPSGPPPGDETDCLQAAPVDHQPPREIERQVFAVAQLPAAVDPARCCAVLHDGLLGIRMLKAEPSSPHGALPRERLPM